MPGGRGGIQRGGTSLVCPRIGGRVTLTQQRGEVFAPRRVTT
ncbi:MAG: hypothetical protein AAF805_10415 [Planctomycetota bacterium]